MLKTLSQADLLRLRRIGTQYAGGTNETWEDLLNEAICLSLQGERRCRRNIAILTHLRSAMRSIAFSIRKKDQRIKTVSIGTPIESSDDEDLMIDPQDHTPNIETRLIHENCLDELFKLFEDDDENTGLVLIGIAVGQAPAEIQAQVGITSTEYDTIRRRISRGINKVYPEGLPI